MDGVEDSRSTEQHQKLKNGNSLRVIAFIFSITATIVMMTNKEFTVVDGIKLKMKYNYSSILRFFLWSNLCAAIIIIISWYIIFRVIHKPPSPCNCFCLYCFDMMATLFLGGGVVAEAIFLCIAEFGDTRLGWLGICDHFKGFCSGLIVSFCLSMASFFLYVCNTALWVTECRKSNRINPV